MLYPQSRWLFSKFFTVSFAKKCLLSTLRIVSRISTNIVHAYIAMPAIMNVDRWPLLRARFPLPSRSGASFPEQWLVIEPRLLLQIISRVRLNWLLISFASLSCSEIRVVQRGPLLVKWQLDYQWYYDYQPDIVNYCSWLFVCFYCCCWWWFLFLLLVFNIETKEDRKRQISPKLFFPLKAWLYGFLPGHHFSWEEETYCDETDIELKVYFLTRFTEQLVFWIKRSQDRI